MTYAWLDPNGTVIIMGTNPSDTAVDVTNVNPQPGVGWTTPDKGVTWNPPSANSALGNQAILLQKAANALNNNLSYLAIPSPTQAQAVAQVTALTRQVDALIRLAADLLADTSGT